jgi:hypothetical protein
LRAAVINGTWSQAAQENLITFAIAAALRAKNCGQQFELSWKPEWREAAVGRL